MFNKRNLNFSERMNYSNQFDPNMSNMYPNFQYEKLQYEIKENRRRINNLAKRIVRIENYLRIRDTSDYIIPEEENPNFPL